MGVQGKSYLWTGSHVCLKLGGPPHLVPFLDRDHVCLWSLYPSHLSCFLVPELIDGRTFTATVVGLNPWVEYEFRTVAANTIGIGEPSQPSEKRRTEEARE